MLITFYKQNLDFLNHAYNIIYYTIVSLGLVIVRGHVFLRLS